MPRSASTALQYFSSATAIGPWAGWLRRGFDQYLRGQFERSVGAYLHAAEIGTFSIHDLLFYMSSFLAIAKYAN